METGAVYSREYPVHPKLAEFVKCIWSLESERPINRAARERILPDGCVELVFHFHDPFRSHFPDGRAALQPRSFVVGQMNRFLEIEPAGRIGFVAVRFLARGAYLFFDQPMSEVAADVVDLELIWKRRARRWGERIALEPAVPARVRLVQKMLLNILRENSRRPDPTVDRGLQLINAAGGELNVGQLAPTLGISGRQLRRRFHDAVGLSPKEFSRLARFLRTVHCLSGRKHRTLTETAVSCGYFDQSHFNHEFREFAGISPGELFSFPNLAF
jgi:AraC-like DNA-binding protein